MTMLPELSAARKKIQALFGRRVAIGSLSHSRQILVGCQKFGRMQG